MIYRMLFLVLLSGSVGTAFAQDALAQKIKGDWQGVLDVGAAKLRLVLHFTADADNTWRGTMDSPDQSAAGMKIDTIVLEGQTLRFVMRGIGASYEGTINNDASEITGKFTQGGTTLQLNLKRGTVAPPKRPQVPSKPYPYSEEDLTFENKAANIALAGTLTLPRTDAPVPAVVLISGSGPQDRNESLMGHQPFLVLADHLTRAGIAVLRFDDRGIAKSKGNFSTATSEDFATDVLAGVEYLKTRKEIDAKKIGLIGHSEGGLIAPLCAVKSADVAFIVLMAGPGVGGEEILYEQAALIARAQGASASAIAETRKIQAQSFAVLKSEPDVAQAEKKLQAITATAVASAAEAEKKAIEGILSAQSKALNTPWFRFFLSYDPRTTLRQLKIPVLALNGELDLQVPPKQNLPEITKALTAAGNKHFHVVELPKLNHLFQTAKTGSPGEYTQIEETLAPIALQQLSDWITRQTGLKK